MIGYKKSYPSYINKQFKSKKIDAAFISSIKSKNCNCLNLGIVAKNEVDSVLLLPGKQKKDFQSDTSNALAQILGLKGEVIIGDKALKKFYEDKNNSYIDLAKEWKKRYNLPFVFARFCVNKHYGYFKNLSDDFLSKKIYIPQYILKQYANKTDLSVKQIENYLKKISYKLEYREKKSLKLFLKKFSKFF